MFRHAFRSSCTLCSAVIAPKAVSSPEVNEGWERLKKIFERDELGIQSPELTLIAQTTFGSLFVGGAYGGFVHSREAYLRFVERNQATKFADHFEARRKLQDFVTVNFFKGALKWSWRIALFGCFYVTTATILSTYRGKESIFDFVLGGMLAGGIYRINYGLRGVIVGSSLGLMIGLLGGSLTMSFLRLTDSKLDDVRQFQYELDEMRRRNLAEAAKKPLLEEQLAVETGLTRAHDSMVSQRKQQKQQQQQHPSSSNLAEAAKNPV